MGGPFKRMLLATEHSEFDAGSERIALDMAQRCRLPLMAVLPILSNPEFEAVAPQLAQRAEVAAGARLAELAAGAARAGVPWQAVVRRGPALFREIVAEAASREADLLVIRRRGRLGRLANLLVGEMVGQVLANSPCSVLVVPRQAAMWSRHVLVAVDPSAPDPAAIGQGAAVAAECALPLTLLAVSGGGADDDRANQVLSGALADLRRHQPAARAEVLHGKAHQRIGEAASRLGADLIVVGRHGDGGFARAWLGGVAQKVIGLAECPVLVAIPPVPIPVPA
jgi:hypothetical protein